jgi:hypothetical protein
MEDNLNENHSMHYFHRHLTLAILSNVINP